MSNEMGKRRSLGAARFLLLAMAISAVCGNRVEAQSATRDLSGFDGEGQAFTVFISLGIPGGTNAAGVEDTVPLGWTVASISHSGVFDVGNNEVKWGPFFDPAIPPLVSYEITPVGVGSGSSCFDGEVSFDGPTHPITGDTCVAGAAVPAVSTWGIIIMLLLVTSFMTVLDSRVRTNTG